MRVRLLIGLGFAVALALVALAGQLVFTIQRTTPTSYDLPFQLPEPADLIEGVDKSVGMMFSLTLGLFVAAGYALREVGARPPWSSWDQVPPYTWASWRETSPSTLPAFDTKAQSA
jgi:hypothetical protein